MQLDKNQKFELIRKSVRHAVQRAGEMSFQESQKLVPVDTGYLRDSGEMTGEPNSITVKYSADYASIVERGWAGGMVWTRPHIRKGGISVRGHYRNQPPRKETLFIRRSFERHFKEIYTHNRTFFQDTFINSLRVDFASTGAEIKDFKGRSV